MAPCPCPKQRFAAGNRAARLSPFLARSPAAFSRTRRRHLRGSRTDLAAKRPAGLDPRYSPLGGLLLPRLRGPHGRVFLDLLSSRAPVPVNFEGRERMADYNSKSSPRRAPS